MAASLKNLKFSKKIKLNTLHLIILFLDFHVEVPSVHVELNGVGAFYWLHVDSHCEHLAGNVVAIALNGIVDALGR